MDLRWTELKPEGFLNLIIQEHLMEFSFTFFSPVKKLIKLIAWILVLSLNEVFGLIFFEKVFVVLNDFFVVFSNGFRFVKDAGF
jgi:hypothetical protein